MSAGRNRLSRGGQGTSRLTVTIRVTSHFFCVSGRKFAACRSKAENFYPNLSSALIHKLYTSDAKCSTKRSSFCIYYCDAPESVELESLRILWGTGHGDSVQQRKELFSFILRKASLAPPTLDGIRR